MNRENNNQTAPSPSRFLNSTPLTTRHQQEEYHQHEINQYLQAQQRTRQPTQDEYQWGDIPDFTTKHPRTIRFAFQNVNSADYNNTNTIHKIFSDVEKYKFDVIGLTETNIRWNNNINKCYRQIARNYTDNPKTIQSSSVDKHINQEIKQPGGTFLMTHSKWTNRTHKATKDHTGMGRWSTFQIQGKHRRIINIVCAYRVVQTKDPPQGNINPVEYVPGDGPHPRPWPMQTIP